MAVLTRIKNNQVTDASAGNVYLGVNAAAKVQDYSITGGKIQNNLTYGSDLTITGNLTVQGNTTTIDTVNLVVEDPLILLAKEQTGSPSLDIGFIGKRGTSDNIAWVWDESANSFVSVFTTSEVTNTVISINSYAAITTANISATTGNFSGNVQVANLSVVGNISGAANFSGNVTASNFLTTGIVSATGNVTGGNVNTGGAVSATGNVNSGNVNTAIVSASGNVNSGNVNTAIVSASGNIVGANLVTGGLITATGNINGANVNTAQVASTGGITITSGGSSDITLSAGGNINAGTNYINNVVNPVQNQDAATKIYVDNLVTTAISYHEAVFVATTANLATTTSGTITYAQPNGAGNGVGATITTTGAFNLIDTGNVQTIGTRILVKDEGNAVLNGIYVWSNATVITRSTDADTYGPANANTFSINDYFFVEDGSVNKGSAYIVDSPSGTITFGTSNIQFAQFSQAQVYSANTQAGISLTGTVFAAKVDNNTTAFDGGGNISVKAGANLTTPNIGAATGTSLSVTGNVTASYFIGNISGNIDAAGANTQVQFNNDDLLGASANFTFNTATNILAVTGTVQGTTVSATGNVIGGNVSTAGLITATGNITGANLILTSGTIDGPAAGRITVNASDLDTDFAIDGDSTPNVFYVDAGLGTTSFGNSGAIANAIASFNTSNSIKLPVGNTAQRPDPAAIGMTRFSTAVDALEVYTSGGWETVGVPAFTVITDDQFTGTGACTTFTLSEDSTTAATIVSINGVVQIPTTAYSVTGNSLVFTEAPEVSDVIDARLLTTTTTVTSIENVSGNAIVAVSDTAATVQITGNILPVTSNTYNLGSGALRWNELFLQGSTITLGNVVIKNTSGNTIGFFGPDGTTPGAIDTNNIDSAGISNGNSSFAVIASGGNIRANVGGATILQITSAGIINGQGNGVGNIGNATGYFNTIFAKATSAQYADLAEMYVADQMIEPGTVVCFGGDHEITICDQDSCSRVAGVVSTNPSYIMNAGLAGDHVVAVALTGRVPTRVTGQVRKGDMMVSTRDGRARACATPAVGQVIGKALADFDGTDGVIEVVVGRL